MWVKKYSRIVVLFLLILAFGATAFWGARHGQRWTSLLAFVIYMVAATLILPRLPSPIAHPIAVRDLLNLAAGTVRFLGFVAALGCVLGVVSHSFLSNPLPLWLLGPVLLVWAAWACGCFWLAKWISKKARGTNPSQILDFGLPFRKP